MLTSSFRDALLTGVAMGAACAVLSVVVVLRRWAFIGEGIAHAGFGGVATAWLASLAVPALASQGGAQLIAVVFCLVTALLMGWLSRGERVTGDTAIGICLIATLAWGFIAFAIYGHARGTPSDVSWEQYLLGEIGLITPGAMRASVCASAAVLLVVAMLWKEIIAYAFDPKLAQVSGARVGFIHYLLMVLLALVIVIGMRLAGNLLVPALLVMPGAAALLCSRKMSTVIAIAITVNLIGVSAGLFIKRAWFPYVPAGPAIAVVLVMEFVVALAVTGVRQSMVRVKQ